jgi:hypothetical protein
LRSLRVAQRSSARLSHESSRDSALRSLCILLASSGNPVLGGHTQMAAPMKYADYDRSVFLNCPFDHAYSPMFDALVFAVMDCGFHVRCAKESSDASRVRIQNLYELVRASRLGIHDLSRTELDASTSLPRFNMPLELGIFLGAKAYGDPRQHRKECLILDREKFRYQKYVSDVAGQDVVTHEANPQVLVARVRDWLAIASDQPLTGAAHVWERYNRFRSELRELCRKAKQDPEELTFVEYVRYVDAFRPSRDDALVLADRTRLVNPSPAQLRQALHRLPGGDDSFAIFEKSGSGLTYMQTLGGPQEGFGLEYQEGSTDAHYVSTDRALPVERVVQAFLWYSAGDARWRTDYEWQPMEI